MLRVCECCCRANAFGDSQRAKCKFQVFRIAFEIQRRAQVQGGCAGICKEASCHFQGVQNCNLRVCECCFRAGAFAVVWQVFLGIGKGQHVISKA